MINSLETLQKVFFICAVSCKAEVAFEIGFHVKLCFYYPIETVCIKGFWKLVLKSYKILHPLFSHFLWTEQSLVKFLCMIDWEALKPIIFFQINFENELRVFLTNLHSITLWHFKKGQLSVSQSPVLKFKGQETRFVKHVWRNGRRYEPRHEKLFLPSFWLLSFILHLSDHPQICSVFMGREQHQNFGLIPFKNLI